MPSHSYERGAAFSPYKTDSRLTITTEKSDLNHLARNREA